MRVLFLAAEVAPYVSVGGLSQVMLFLPKALNKVGNDCRVFTAKYGSMDKTGPGKKPWKLAMDVEGLKVPINNNDFAAKELICNIKTYPAGKYNLFTYFLENKEYYELRANVFGYKDDHVRFDLLSKGCLEWLRHQWEERKKAVNKDDVWWPDVIHCNDWHTGYFVELARTMPRYQDVLQKVPIVFTVHNFTYQGNYEFKFQDPKDKDNGEAPLAPLLSDGLLKQNALARGIIYADEVNTVSPTHAVEVLTHEYAEGLDDILTAARGKLTGILNGLDTREFNPATDPIIAENFTTRNFSKKRPVNKAHLQKIFQLPIDPTAPLLASSGRISYQKGWDMILEILPHLLSAYPKLQFVALGSGDDYYRLALLKIQEQFPERVKLHLRADFRLPRKIFAGADIVLMPSTFEPGGIVAIESLRYGAIPVIRRTGGLNDIITEFDAQTGNGNGFSFNEKDSWQLLIAIVRAISIYKQTKFWQQVVRNALTSDFSWRNVAHLYNKWYKRILEEKKRGTSKTPHPAYNAVIVKKQERDSEIKPKEGFEYGTGNGVE